MNPSSRHSPSTIFCYPFLSLFFSKHVQKFIYLFHPPPQSSVLPPPHHFSAHFLLSSLFLSIEFFFPFILFFIPFSISIIPVSNFLKSFLHPFSSLFYPFFSSFIHFSHSLIHVLIPSFIFPCLYPISSHSCFQLYQSFMRSLMHSFIHFFPIPSSFFLSITSTFSPSSPAPCFFSPLHVPYPYRTLTLEVLIRFDR